MWFSAYCHVETYLSRALCTRLLDHVLGKVTHWQYWRGFRLSLSLLFVSCRRQLRRIDWERCLQPGNWFLGQEAESKRSLVGCTAFPTLAFTPKVTPESTFITKQYHNEQM